MEQLKKNDLFEAVFDGYTAEGAAVCRRDGLAVFVPGGLSGERALVRAVKVHKTYAFGRLERVLEPSPHRVAPDCPHWPACGGCDFRQMDYGEELRLKAARVRDALTRLGGFTLDIPEIVPSPETAHYRNKAQFPVGAAEGRAVFGFFRSRSHELVPLKTCALIRPEAAALAAAVCRWADEQGVLVYNEETNSGLLRHVYVRSGDGHLLTVVSAGPLPTGDALAAAARAACPDLRGVVVNYNSAPGNRILGDRCETLWGEGRLRDTLLGRTYRLSPLSFYQVNRPQAEALYQAALDLSGLDGDQDALDLYCGVGTITLTLAARCRSVVGVEIVADAVRDAERGAEENGVRNVRFLCGDAGTAAAKLAAEGFRPAVVVCDPPRRGLDGPCLDAIATLRPKRIVYISCDPAALARDAKLLRAQGWELGTVRAFDLFPRTANVETVVLLSQQHVDHHIELDLDELDATSAETKATYNEIQQYVLKETGLMVSNLYIAQVKKKCGIEVGESFNKPKSENAKQPKCPVEKEKAIKDALVHFGMI